MMMEATVNTAQGEFTVRYNPKKYHPSNDVNVVDGVVIWYFHRPAGLMIQYPDKTKRFVKYDFHEGERDKEADQE